MAKTTTTQFAKVALGYEEFILPLSKATTLVELLAEARQATPVDLELCSFDKSLSGHYVEKSSDTKLAVRLELVKSDALPHFDQRKALTDHRKARDGDRIAPFWIDQKEGYNKYELKDSAGEVLSDSWSYNELRDEALKRKGIAIE